MFKSKKELVFVILAGGRQRILENEWDFEEMNIIMTVNKSMQEDVQIRTGGGDRSYQKRPSRVCTVTSDKIIVTACSL